jgi:hypothetical protein
VVIIIRHPGGGHCSPHCLWLDLHLHMQSVPVTIQKVRMIPTRRTLHTTLCDLSRFIQVVRFSQPINQTATIK